MRKSPAVLTLVSVVALVAVLGVGVWLLSREPPSQARRLPDGALLELKQVTYGKRHRFREQRLWQQLFAPLLPPAFQGKEVMRMGTPREDALVCWFLQGNQPQPWYLVRPVVAIDEHGCRIGSGFEGGFGGFHGRMQVPYRTAGLELFPRRARRFSLEIYERDAQKPVAEFTVTNPTPGPHPIWQPEPLPIEKRRGSLMITLMTLTTGVTRQELRRSLPAIPPDDLRAVLHPSMRGRSWSHASFQIRENGAPTDRWQIAEVTVSDATGNKGSSIRTYTVTDAAGNMSTSMGWNGVCIRSRTNQAGNAWAAFPGLCLREAAWKLRATLAYAGTEDRLPPDLRWTVPGVAMPPPWRARTANGSAITGLGGALKLQGVLGRGAFGTDPPLMKDANVRVIVTAAIGAGLTLALRATDDRGRPVLCSRGDSTNMGPYHKWWFDMKTLPGAKRLTLTFLGWQGRSVEFLARPAVAQTG
jgi:hypothetical protein